MCHVAFSVSFDASGRPIFFDRRQVLPRSLESWTVGP
jgi:hypothetical protein